MVVRSPSPVVGEGGGLPGVEDLEEAGEEEWPPEHSSFVSNRVSFWELGPIPVGSVITFLQDPEEEGPIPAIIAVVVTGSEPKNSEGVQILVKFLGSDQAWGKTLAVGQFSRKKRGLHICKGGEPCMRSDAVHLTEFGYWPPGTFRGKEKHEGLREVCQKPAEPGIAPDKETLEPEQRKNWVSFARGCCRRGAKLRHLRGGQFLLLHFPPKQDSEETEASTFGEVRRFGGVGGEFRIGVPGFEEEPGRKTPEGSALYAAIERRTHGSQASLQVVPATGSKTLSSTGDSKRKKKEKKEKTKKKKKKSSSSDGSSSDSLQSSSDSSLKPPLQRKAEKRPGSVFRLLLNHVRLSIIERFEFGRSRGSGRGRRRQLFSKSYFLLSDHGSTASRKSAKRRKGVTLVGSCVGYPQKRQLGEDSRPPSSKIHGSGNCCLRWQLGHSPLARGGKAGRKGISFHGDPSCSSPASTDGGTCIWPRILREVRQWLGCWTVSRWWTMGRLVGSWSRKRKERQKWQRQGQERKSRKERYRSELVGRPTKRCRKEGRREEAGHGKVTCPPVSDDLARQWASELVDAAMASAGSTDIGQPPICVEGADGLTKGNPPMCFSTRRRWELLPKTAQGVLALLVRVRQNGANFCLKLLLCNS